MALVDFNYYSTEYKGRLTAERFGELAAAAEQVVAALCPLKSPDTAEDTLSVKQAVCYEADFIASQGGAAAINGGAEFLTSQLALGDCKLSRSASGIRQIGGIPVSPLTLTLLSQAGLRERWA